MRHESSIQTAILTADSIEHEVLSGSPLVKVRFHQPKSREARRPSTAAAARFHTRAYSGYSHYSQVRPRRRRLRREIRWIGWTILTTLPLLSAMLLLRGSTANAVSIESSGATPYAISIDPPGSLVSPRASIVFPGYLLPDDGSSEDPAHAGG